MFGWMIDERTIETRYAALRDQLDERGRRLFAAAEVQAIGYGGLAAVARATGLSRGTIARGLKDLDRVPLPKGRVRREGGGRHPLSVTDPTLLEDLRRIVEPVTLGDPVRPLQWVSKSHKKLAIALQAQGHTVSPNTVRKLLPQLGYSRQANRKANDGRQHADRCSRCACASSRRLRSSSRQGWPSDSRARCARRTSPSRWCRSSSGIRVRCFAACTSSSSAESWRPCR